MILEGLYARSRFRRHNNTVYFWFMLAGPKACLRFRILFPSSSEQSSVLVNECSPLCPYSLVRATESPGLDTLFPEWVACLSASQTWSWSAGRWDWPNVNVNSIAWDWSEVASDWVNSLQMSDWDSSASNAGAGANDICEKGSERLRSFASVSPSQHVWLP